MCVFVLQAQRLTTLLLLPSECQLGLAMCDDIIKVGQMHNGALFSICLAAAVDEGVPAALKAGPHELLLPLGNLVLFFGLHTRLQVLPPPAAAVALRQES